MAINLVQLSRTMAYVLRHQPDRFGLTMDTDGWVSVADFVAVLRQHRPEWQELQGEDFARVIEQSSKQRYEMRDGLIRAAYGHSFKQKVSHESATPPVQLFHGTTPAAYEKIRQTGLKPMGRQYVHLSEDEETARLVALRRTKKPVILIIDAHTAREAEINFYVGNDKVWLADAIPPHFITRK
jgi:putative RNA 2'-phosphotransferase